MTVGESRLDGLVGGRCVTSYFIVHVHGQISLAMRYDGSDSGGLVVALGSRV